MAKVVFTAIVAELSGRLAGSVFQKSVGGYQLHTLGIPINRRTPAQQLNRITLEFLASHWRTLDESEQLTYPGDTNQERFTNYIKFNFRWAWQSGELVTDFVTKTARSMPDWYVAFANVSGGAFIFGAGETTGNTFNWNPKYGSYMFREFTPPDRPINGAWRTYRLLEQFLCEDNQTGIDLTNDIFPAIPAPPVGWQSEFILQYESETEIGVSNPITFSRQS